MRKFEYERTYKLPEGMTGDEAAERLYESGLDDALIGIGREGYVAIDVTREAPSRRVAWMSIERDVEHAIPGIHALNRD